MDKILQLPNTTEHDSEERLSSIVDRSLESLNHGNVIAVPTDTIYGVAAFAQSTQAVDKIYELKKRHREKAIAICVGSIDEIKLWAQVSVGDEVLEDLLPGPVTLIFHRTEQLNSELNPATDSIGVRIPLCPFIQRLASAAKQPLALTSANVSAATSTLKIKEFEEIWPSLDLIIDAGTLSNSEESRSGSTVIDLTERGTFLIIRDGCARDNVITILENKHNLQNREGRR